MFRVLVSTSALVLFSALSFGQVVSPLGASTVYFVCSEKHPTKCATAPKVSSRVDPTYTEEARKNHVEGTVVLWTVITASGEVSQVKVARGLEPGLDQQALKAVKQWRFEPAKYEGTPVAVNINVEVNFRLYNSTTGGSISVLPAEPTSSEPAAKSIPSPEDIRREYSQAYTAYEQRDFATSIALAKKLSAVIPGYSPLWNLLGMDHLALGELEEAEQALKRAVETDPSSQWAFNNLGRVYQAQRRFEESVVEFRKQIDLNSQDRFAYANLGASLISLKRWKDAIGALQKAAELTPKNPMIQLNIGRCQLELGQKEEALKSFDAALGLGSSPDMWNGVAWELAKHNIELERAAQYAQLAVNAATSMMHGLSLEHVEMSQFARTRLMSSYWDTLGYVRFRQGDLESARSYIEAAWGVSPNAEIGLHRGEVYEKLGRRDDAAQAFAGTLALRGEPAKELPDESNAFEQSTKRLEALMTDKPLREKLLGSAAQEWKNANRVRVANTSKVSGTAEVAVLLKSDRTVVARAISGGGALSAAVKNVANWKVPETLPTGVSADMVRRGTMTCPAPDQDCELKLMTAREATEKPLPRAETVEAKATEATAPSKRSNLAGRQYASETLGMRIMLPEDWVLLTEAAPTTTTPGTAIFGRPGALVALVLVHEHLESTPDMYLKLMETQMKKREGFARIAQASAARDNLAGTRWTMRWMENDIPYRGVMEIYSSRDEHFRIMFGAPEEMFERYTAALNEAIKSVQFTALKISPKDLP